MGGKIIYTRKKTKEQIALMKKKDKQKVNRAKVCIGCVNNQNSFCTKHKERCFKVNYICSSVKNPYVYHAPKGNVANIKAKKVKKITESSSFKKMYDKYSR